MEIAASFPTGMVFDRVSEPVARGAAPRLKSVALLSTMPPLRCGLATFAADLQRAVEGVAPGLSCVPVAVDGEGDAAGFALPKADDAAYRRMGGVLNRAGVDLLCVQHEFGIFGGPDGEMLLDLLDAFDGPVVATLHTVLDQPSPNQRRVMAALVRRAARLVVMTKHSARLMRDVYGTQAERLRVVPHGIPSPPDMDRASCRAEFGVEGRPSLTTFGLLSPGKGIEHAIRALPAIAARVPDVLYTVLGATHPNLLREEGERYRTELTELAESLGVGRSVRFLNRYASLPELTRALAATDVYLTPYNNEAQSVSGTLAYSYGLGTAVVSTPYRHAAELLAEGRGTLVPFADPAAIAEAVSALLTDPARLGRVRAAARAAGQEMLWPRVGETYLSIFREALAGPARPVAAGASP